MEDLLEKLIRENKEAFEEDAPEGHLERFEQRLKKQKQLPGKSYKKLYLQIAAAVAFVLLLENQVRMYLQQPATQPKTEEISLASVSPEYSEVEYYYTSTYEQSLQHWQKLAADGVISADEQQLMNEEIKEFDENYQQLQKELQSNPDDERVINAMLELYQTRLSIINLIIEKLESMKTHKANEHESEI